MQLYLPSPLYRITPFLVSWKPPVKRRVTGVTGSREEESATLEAMEFPEELANPDLVGALVQVSLCHGGYLKKIQSYSA